MRLVDTLKKIDSIEARYREQIRLLAELRRSLTHRAMVKTGRCPVLDLEAAHRAVDGKRYDSALIADLETVTEIL